MASHSSPIKIHDRCQVAPPCGTEVSLPLTFFDLLWLRFHPVERIFFYSLPIPHSHPSFYFDKVVPKLKTSLSDTLQHFLPLAGNIVWLSDSHKPIIKYTPGDVVSLVIAESDADFNHIVDNSPHEAAESRPLVPHLASSDSLASVISLQITLFPNSGFCIGIATHHAVLDGKSSTMFIKAWASLCQAREESSSLAQELEPFFEREVIKDPNGLGLLFINNWTEASRILDPADDSNRRSLKIMANSIQPNLEHSVRATFELTRADLEKIKKRVLSMWDVVDGAQSIPSSKPPTLSTFILTCAYVSVCIAKAIGVERDKQKFYFSFTVDCRARLDSPIPENYFGNCATSQTADTQPEDFTKEDGLVIVAKKIHSKIKMLDKGVLDGADRVLSRYMSMLSEGVNIIAVAGSTRFGVYGTDFGWGRPAKVEITSVDRGLTIGMAESKDGKGGVEVGLVLNKHVMGLFHTLFHEGVATL